MNQGRQVTKAQATEAGLVCSSELTLEPVALSRILGLRISIYKFILQFFCSS